MEDLRDVCECIVSKYRDMNIPLDMEKLTALLVLCQALSVKKSGETIFAERIMRFDYRFIIPEALHLYGIGDMSEDVKSKDVVSSSTPRADEEIDKLVSEVIVAIGGISSKVLTSWLCWTIPKTNDEKCFDKGSMKEWNSRNEILDLKNFVRNQFYEVTQSPNRGVEW